MPPSEGARHPATVRDRWNHKLQRRATCFGAAERLNGVGASYGAPALNEPDQDHDHGNHQ